MALPNEETQINRLRRAQWDGHKALGSAAARLRPEVQAIVARAYADGLTERAISRAVAELDAVLARHERDQADIIERTVAASRAAAAD